jgi:mono/diheme cytochrome c family protein
MDQPAAPTARFRPLLLMKLNVSGHKARQIGLDQFGGGRKMKPFMVCCMASLFLAAATDARGADADAGRRLAQLRCVACHIVGQNHGDEVADAPPFVVIGQKFGFNHDSLIVALMGPHAKMNFSLGRRDADDIAAYIITLTR